MQLEYLLINYYGVSSVYTALIPHYDICRATKQISDFAFSFVAPLGTNYNYVSQENECVTTISQTMIIPNKWLIVNKIIFSTNFKKAKLQIIQSEFTQN